MYWNFTFYVDLFLFLSSHRWGYWVCVVNYGWHDGSVVFQGRCSVFVSSYGSHDGSVVFLGRCPDLFSSYGSHDGSLVFRGELRGWMKCSANVWGTSPWSLRSLSDLRRHLRHHLRLVVWVITRWSLRHYLMWVYHLNYSNMAWGRDLISSLAWDRHLIIARHMLCISRIGIRV